jgi:tetratricopeptide (TPR) repeat protein
MKKLLTAVVCLSLPITAVNAADVYAPFTTGLDKLRTEAAAQPQNIDIQKKFAAECLKEHHEADALAAAGAAVAINPNDPEANRLYVISLARTGKYQDAMDAHKDNGLTDRPLKKVLDAAALARQAEDLLQKAGAQSSVPPPATVWPPLASSHDEYEEAARLFQQAVDLDPENMAIRLTLGWVYLDKLQNPLACYRQESVVARRHPNDVDARKLCGLAALQLGWPNRAVAEFRVAAEIQPDDLWIQVSLAKSLARTHHFQEADKIYQQVLAKDPSNPGARLGEAELGAWRGQSAKPLETLNGLIGENPTNVDALVLRGDVERWDWDLTDARRDYNSALAVAPNNYDAQNGRSQAQWMGGSGPGVGAYQFNDTAGFHRENVNGGLRLKVADDLYLLGDGAAWRFRQDNDTNLYRFDGSGGLEYHWSRWLEVSGEADTFTYKDRDTFLGGHGTAKIEAAPGYDLFAGVGYHQPYISSIATVTNNIKQDQGGAGFDFKVAGPVSVQNNLQAARLTDDNNWWEEKPQLSVLVYEPWGIYLRAQYDYLAYKQTNSGYFSPTHWDSIAPAASVSIPIFRRLHLNGDASAPYVITESKFGVQFQAGPSIDLTPHLQINGSYTKISIPGDQGNWSGYGWQASAKLRF